MVTILQPARARVCLEDIHACSKFKGKVERGAVENRDISRSYNKAAQAGHEGLYASARHYIQPVSQGAESADKGRPHAADLVRNGRVHLMLNTTEGATSLADSKPLRRAALLHKTPYYTTLAGSIAAAQGVKAYISGDLEVRALQDYFA